jgi:hypothetical protein
VNPKYAGPSNDVIKAYIEPLLNINPLDLAAYLTTVKFEDWNARELPATKGAQPMIERGLDNWKQWYNEILKEGQIEMSFDLKTSTGGDEVYFTPVNRDEPDFSASSVTFYEDEEGEERDIPVYIETKLLYKHYDRWFKAKKRAGTEIHGDLQTTGGLWSKLAKFLPAYSKKNKCSKQCMVDVGTKRCIAFSVANKDMFREGIGHPNWVFEDEAEEVVEEVE